MAVRHFSYLDIPKAKRAIAAERQRQQLGAVLTSNFLPVEQMSQLRQRLMSLDLWERGVLPKR
jgi:hypothetical protein